MFHHAKDESEDFLPNLTQSFKQIDVEKPIPTKDFVSACSKVQPIFDHIGTFFCFLFEFFNDVVSFSLRAERGLRKQRGGEPLS